MATVVGDRSPGAFRSEGDILKIGDLAGSCMVWFGLPSICRLFANCQVFFVFTGGMHVELQIACYL